MAKTKTNVKKAATKPTKATAKKAATKTTKATTKKTAPQKTAAKKKVTKKPVKQALAKKRVTGAKKVTRIAPAKAAPVKATGGKKKGYLVADLNYFRKIIEEKRKEVLEEIETQRDTLIDPMTGEYRQDTSSYSLHMEHGTDSMEREKAYLLVAREARFLENLNAALQRIKNKKYGWCKDCGNLIEKRRLEAVPHAQLCAACKNKRGGTPQEA